MAMPQTPPPSTPLAHAPAPAPGLRRLLELAAATPLQPPCAHFYFLRHGQTPRNAQRIFQHWDEPLSELGEQQAAAAATVLAPAPIRRIVCSDARRALHTAQFVAAPHGLEPLATDLLRERHFGALIGTSSANIDWDCAPEGGETLPEFVDRTRAALQNALALEGPVLIVAHGGSLYVLAALLGVPIDGQVMGNAQPLHFANTQGAWAVRSLLAPTANALAHAALA